MDKLIEKTKALGRRLTFDEVHSDPEMFVPMAYAIYYDDFDNAATRAWDKVKISKTISTGTTKLVSTHNEASKKKEVCQMSRHRYTKEEVVQSLRRYYSKNGKLPTQKDVNNNPAAFPSYGTIVKFLGPKDHWPATILESSMEPSEQLASELSPEPSPSLPSEQPTPEQPTPEPIKEAEEPLRPMPILELRISIPGTEEPIILEFALKS